MNTSTSPRDAIRDLADLHQSIDALARGECTEEEFLSETLDLLDSESDLSWDVLAYIDQRYRCGHLNQETFHSIKFRIAQRAIGERGGADDYRDGMTVELYPARPRITVEVEDLVPAATATSQADVLIADNQAISSTNARAAVDGPAADDLRAAAPRTADSAIAADPVPDPVRPPSATTSAATAPAANPITEMPLAVIRTKVIPAAGTGGGVSAAEGSTGPVLETGQILRNRYVVQGLLGRGGMGDVYEAIDSVGGIGGQSQLRVAIKVLRASSNQRPELIARLQREFDCTRKLSHPNVVKVHEFDRVDDWAFYTMELLAGEHVEDLLIRGNGVVLPRPYAWALVGAIGAALAHAHTRSVIHGDLSPKNIMVTSSGEVRVLDFGSSTMSNGIAVPAVFDAMGAVAATPAFASCEVLEGERANPRDDLYALACIAYELLAGQRPFPGKRATEARDAGLQPRRPPGLNFTQWRTLQLGLSWTRDERSISVRQWLARLGLEPEPECLPPLTLLEKPRPRVSRTTSAIGVFVIAAVAGSIMLWRSLHPEPYSTDPALVGSMPPAAEVSGARSPAAESATSASTAVQADSGPAAQSPGAIPEVPAALTAQGADTPAPAPVPAPGVSADLPRKPRAAPPSVVQRPAFGFTAHRYFAGPAAHYVETRIWRANASDDSGGYVWWTDDSSAKAEIDYVGQIPMPHAFARGSRRSSLFVRLLPNPQRTRSADFRVCIGRSGGAARTRLVTCSSIQLPAS